MGQAAGQGVLATRKRADLIKVGEGEGGRASSSLFPTCQTVLYEVNLRAKCKHK